MNALEFDAETVPLGVRDTVILAVPAPVAARLLPGLVVPTEFRAIVNAHYRVDVDAGLPLLMGVIGGTAEWIFRKPGIVSVTVSAADRLWIRRPRLSPPRSGPMSRALMGSAQPRCRLGAS